MTLCDLVEGGKVCTGGYVRVRCDLCVVCVSTGGVLPVLAQQWHRDPWRVHSGATGRGDDGRICTQDSLHHTC